MDALAKVAAKIGLAEDDIEGSSKHPLVFKILEAQAKKQGLLFSEGVLECLEDGFGFLRAPEFSYLPSQDDIYVSPSQIRKFQLRTGDTISGVVRAPKNGEKYFALIRIEAVNFLHPARRTTRRSSSSCNFHPHLHLLMTGGDKAGIFHRLPHLDDVRLAEIFGPGVLRLLVDRGLLSPEWAERILSWRHTGFNVHSRVRARTKTEAERIGKYMVRPILALGRLSPPRAGRR